MDEAKICEIIRAERNAYSRAWREKNSDKVKAHNAKYWRKRAERKLQEQQGVSENDTDNR